MNRRVIRTVYCVRVDRDGYVAVHVASPLTWFAIATTQAAYFGDVRCIDQHGRMFARADGDGSGRVLVRMDRGDREVVGVDAAGDVTPDAAIAIAERYSWARARYTRCAEEDALAVWLAERSKAESAAVARYG